MAGRTTGLGPSSVAGAGGTAKPGVRLGKMRLGTMDEANALLVLVVLEVLAQIVLRKHFSRAHGG